jgi:hypothetical protein
MQNLDTTLPQYLAARGVQVRLNPIATLDAAGRPVPLDEADPLAAALIESYDVVGDRPTEDDLVLMLACYFRASPSAERGLKRRFGGTELWLPRWPHGRVATFTLESRAAGDR